jgi:hypothetical protein
VEAVISKLALPSDAQHNVLSLLTSDRQARSETTHTFLTFLSQEAEDRIRQMSGDAEELRRALGLRPEAKYALLIMKYGIKQSQMSGKELENHEPKL